jgi:RHS repeat-associated protein
VRLYAQGQSQPTYTAIHTYDNAGQLLSIRYRKGQSGLQIAKVEYQYDAAGNRTSKATLGAEAGYGYNTHNELIQDQNSGDIRGTQAFNYDKVGNRSQVTWPTGPQSYSTPNSLNRLQGTGIGPNGAFQFSYDAEGSRTGKYVNETQGMGEMEGSTSYVWDGKTRLQQATLPDSTVVSYAYDYQNRMVKRVKGSEVRTFLHGNGNQVIEETLNGQRLALYGWGPDGLISRSDANGQVLIYLKDGLGSVMAVIDENANIMQSYEYSAFGENLAGKDAVNQFQFVGGYGGQTDELTGLVYFWNRWYDPQVGRWVSEDPIRHAGGVNLFGYVANRPTTSIDPTGLRAIAFGVTTVIRPEHPQAGTKTLHIITVDSETGQKLSEEANFVGSTNVGVGDVSGIGRFNGSSSGGNGCLNVNLSGWAFSLFFGLQINYNFNITHDANDGRGHLSGSHDGYPSYEVWAAGRKIYDHHQGHLGQLIGSGDVSVNRNY